MRRAHRSSATRSINQIDAAIESNDARRLRQLKQSLANKLTVLAKLDDEVIELMEEDDLEAEVEQADEVRERIDLAILTIEDALIAHQASEGSGTPRAIRDRADSSSSVSGGEEGRRDERHDTVPMPHPVTTTSVPVTLTPPTTVMSSSISSGTTSSPSAVGGTSSASFVTAAVSTTMPLPSMSPLLGAPPHSTGPSTTTVSTHPTLSVSGVSTYPTLSISDVLATPTLSVSGVSATPSLSVSGVSAPPTLSMSGLYPPAVTYPVPLSVPLSTGVLTPTPYHFPGVPSSCGTVASHYSLPPVPTTVPHPSMPAVVPQVKLPKLSIRKFSGDLTKWVTF